MDTPFKFIPRPYLHFDYPVSEEIARRIATDPAKVVSHPFFPFIRYDIVTQKIEKKSGGGVQWKQPKPRRILYGSHVASHIFTHYASLITELYERQLQNRGLNENVIGFRSLDKKRNIHFANDTFEFIRTKSGWAVLALDVSDFFGNLNHRKLKAAWQRLLGRESLPGDHYSVFRAITVYCEVDRDSLFKVLALDPNDPRADGRRRLCSPDELRRVVRGNGLCRVNRSGKGIPQGSPISAVLSNLYMLEFDTRINSLVASYNGLYRRYCDDLLVVLPTVEARAHVYSEIRSLLEDLAIQAHPEKTEEIDFRLDGDRLVASKPLNYLGFTFDGQHKRIRPASIARFYKKMRLGVLRAKLIARRADRREGRTTPSPLRCRKLYLHYSYLGRRNFLKYAFDAYKIMRDSGIKKQVKAHWKRLQALIEKPL